MTCTEKCSRLGRIIPSFTTVIKRDHVEFLSLCDPEKPCSFPIDVSFDHSAKVWRDGTMGEVVSLPWKLNDVEWPVYPVMNDVVWVLHGQEYTPSNQPSECFSFSTVLTPLKSATRYAVMDAYQCNYKPDLCPIKKFWCSNSGSMDTIAFKDRDGQIFNES